VVLAEAGTELGGQFRLAGLQPRRAQILDLIEWYGRQLEKLGVEVRYNWYLDADDIAGENAEHIIIGTGSLPRGTGFQKSLAHVERLPGIDAGSVWSPEDVMMRAARLGKRVVVLDEGGNWRGCGTAWKLAEDGHEVTVVTPDPLVGKELQRSAADFPLRQNLAKAGVRFVTESAIIEWGEQGADIIDLLAGGSDHIEADSLVLATPNVSNSDLAEALTARGVPFDLIGDGAAPRLAAYAFHEGRKVGLAV